MILSNQLVKAICNSIKARHFNVDPNMVRTFTSLRIQERHIRNKEKELEEQVTEK